MINARAYGMWNRALERAKLMEKDVSTNRATIHYHVLRKVFRSQLDLVIPYDIVEALMGHEGYLQDVYKKYPDTEKTLSEYYVKGEHALLVFTEAKEASKLRVEIEKGKTELQETLNLVTKENMELRSQQKQTVEELEKVIERLEKQDNEMKELRKLIREIYEHS